eukprot:scaffold22770_cov156-Cylindrotheca_fusiformis.AAC.2
MPTTATRIEVQKYEGHKSTTKSTKNTHDRCHFYNHLFYTINYEKERARGKNANPLETFFDSTQYFLQEIFSSFAITMTGKET